MCASPFKSTRLWITTIFAFACVVHGLSAQDLTVYENGLIYKPNTVRILSAIVDSLNLQHLQCTTNPTYQTLCQTLGAYSSFEGTAKDMKAIAESLKGGMEPEKLVQAWSSALKDSAADILVIKYQDSRRDYQSSVDVPGTTYHTPLFKGHNGRSLFVADSAANAQMDSAGHWVYSVHYSEYAGASSLRAFYLYDDFTSKALPPFYARLVQYADCLIDTTTTVMIEGSAQGDFLDYMSTTAIGMFRFEKSAEDFSSIEEYYEAEEQHKQSQAQQLSELLSGQQGIGKTVKAMLVDSLCECRYPEEMEEFIGRNVSKELALELKRRRKVWGSCSMDDSPRIHAQQIASLAAETVRWDVFLRAHLNIMNDRFDRASDGSYAWAGRKTYIRELEELNINVHDLLFGITLSVDNPAEHHYYGSIGRLGRALSETREAEAFQNRVLSMIHDNNLDAYNRVRCYLLYLSYLYNLPDENESRQQLLRLRDSVETFPEFLHAAIQSIEIEEE